MTLFVDEFRLNVLIFDRVTTELDFSLQNSRYLKYKSNLIFSKYLCLLYAPLPLIFPMSSEFCFPMFPNCPAMVCSDVDFRCCLFSVCSSKWCSLFHVNCWFHFHRRMPDEMLNNLSSFELFEKKFLSISQILFVSQFYVFIRFAPVWIYSAINAIFFSCFCPQRQLYGVRLVNSETLDFVYRYLLI